MALRFHITRSRRELLPALALVFLLQTVAPFFMGVMASPVAGYFDVLCTMSGPQRVFVRLDQQQPQKPPACHECPSCILQLNLDDDTLPVPSVAMTRLKLRQPKPAERIDPETETRHYFRYLSRAPPA